MEEVTIERLVEMIVFCPDWREKAAILNRYIKLMVRRERIEQIRQELDKMDEENELDET